MTTTIKNRFKNKDHYLAFRTAWAKAVNHEDAKSKVVGPDAVRIKGWITATHHILFNYLCGKPLTNGFSPITNKNKLEHGAIANQAYDNAFRTFDNFWLPLIEKSAGKRALGKYDRKQDIDKRVDSYIQPILFFSPELRDVIVQAIVGDMLDASQAIGPPKSTGFVGELANLARAVVS